MNPSESSGRALKLHRGWCDVPIFQGTIDPTRRPQVKTYPSVKNPPIYGCERMRISPKIGTIDLTNHLRTSDNWNVFDPEGKKIKWSHRHHYSSAARVARVRVSLAKIGEGCVNVGTTKLWDHRVQKLKEWNVVLERPSTLILVCLIHFNPTVVQFLGVYIRR